MEADNEDDVCSCGTPFSKFLEDEEGYYCPVCHARGESKEEGVE